MAKKSKRSRGGSSKSKQSKHSKGARASSAPLSSSGAPAYSVREPNPRTQTREQTSELSSETRTRAGASASGGILPPPRKPSASEPNADEISIPPVTSPPFSARDARAERTDTRELEDSFFVRRAGLDLGAHHAQHDAEVDQVDPRTAQKMTAAARARRAHLTRYVKWTVGVAAAVCALAVGRMAVQGKPVIDPPPPIIHTALAAAPVDTTPHNIQGVDPAANLPANAGNANATSGGQAVAAADPTPAPQQPVANDAVQASPAQPAVADKPIDPPAAQPAAQNAVAQNPTPPAPAATADAPAKSAVEEKKDASKLLERGNAKGAIAAGERSVALDPADGEAWLVLGAAYQQVGKNADARRCFSSCIKEGKRGPVGECRAMLQ